jgi:uncharacterized protein involved in type VI secretion and phage assembly
MTDKKYFGKYRGSVSDINDPMMIGRIKAKVPDVLGEQESSWAAPCAPFGGSSTGFFALPTVNAGVWIEFEQGDPDYPIWSGCWWGSQSEVPSVLLAPPYKKVMIATEGGNKIILDDTSGAASISLETSGGQKIKLSQTAIEIDNGNGATIKLSGASVKINDQALEVT